MGCSRLSRLESRNARSCWSRSSPVLLATRRPWRSVELASLATLRVTCPRSKASFGAPCAAHREPSAPTSATGHPCRRDVPRAQPVIERVQALGCEGGQPVAAKCMDHVASDDVLVLPRGRLSQLAPASHAVRYSATVALQKSKVAFLHSPGGLAQCRCASFSRMNPPSRFAGACRSSARAGPAPSQRAETTPCSMANMASRRRRSRRT